MSTLALILSIVAMGFRVHARWTDASDIEQAKWFVVAIIFLAAHLVIEGLRKPG